MIRWRHGQDNRQIVELVRTQLVPLSPWRYRSQTQLRTEIHHRLRRGATLVASSTRTSSPYGFLHMEIRDTRMYIDLLAIEPKHQGRQWGTGLMRRAEQYGRSRDCQAAHVFVDENNERALRFYTRLGYEPVRRIPSLKVIELNKQLR